jgi:hypothetical protein
VKRLPRAHVAAAQQAGIAGISPRMALATAGAAALAAPDDEAGPLFQVALSVPEADRWPFEQARIQLAYGQWLRRTRDTTRAPAAAAPRGGRPRDTSDRPLPARPARRRSRRRRRIRTELTV